TTRFTPTSSAVQQCRRVRVHKVSQQAMKRRWIRKPCQWPAMVQNLTWIHRAQNSSTRLMSSMTFDRLQRQDIPSVQPTHHPTAPKIDSNLSSVPHNRE